MEKLPQEGGDQSLVNIVHGQEKNEMDKKGWHLDAKEGLKDENLRFMDRVRRQRHEKLRVARNIVDEDGRQRRDEKR